jgi:hypothetical protein
MIIGDPNVVDYAKSQGRYHAVQLAPAKAYFLLAPTRVRALEAGDDLSTIPDSLTVAIARDALRSADAHSLKSSDLRRLGVFGDCDPSAGEARLGIAPITRRVLYDAADPTARDLADRIVSLTAGDPATSTDIAAVRAALPGLGSALASPVAVGVGADELAASLANGSDFAYVVGLPLGRPETCFLPRELLRRAPWLGVGSAPLHLKTVPLVITRSRAVAAQSETGASFALSLDVAGNILIVGTTRTVSP